MNILAINPGSTSTKVSLFDNRKAIFTESVFHDAPLLLSFGSTNGQFSFRRKVVIDILNNHGYTLSDIDIFVGRGGSAHSQKSGVTLIDERLYKDTLDEVAGTDHVAKLGVMLAYSFATEYNKKAYTLNPTNTDELEEVARITGIKGLYRRPQSHALNQKAIVLMHAERMHEDYKKSQYICAHIDGGITVGAHKNGRMIDCTEGAGGDGPFTPTRVGSIPVMGVVRYLEGGGTIEALKKMCSASGGFVSHFGSSDTRIVHSLVEKGDERASLIWEAMLYSIVKSIGEMAAVLSGSVNAILLTGGLVRYPDLVEYIKSHTSFIAPIYTYPGEVEMEALVWGVCDYLEGKTECMTYSGKDVFEGFKWDDKVY